MDTAQAVALLIWAVVTFGLGAAGWAVISLEVLADWLDREGDDAAALLKRRLIIFKGLLASVAAAALVCGTGLYGKWPLPLILLSMFLAGMAGEKFLRPLLEQAIGRVTAAVAALMGQAPK